MDFDAGRDVVVAILKLLKVDVDRNSSECVCVREGRTIRKFCQEPVWRKLGDFNSVATHWRDGSGGIRPMSSPWQIYGSPRGRLFVGNRAYTVATRERICQTEAYLSGSLIQADL